MRKIYPAIKTVAAAVVIIAFFISFICIYFNKNGVKASDKSIALTVWQIDSFEGGKGSRAEFLKNIGNDFGKKENCYINILSLSSDAARMNLANDNIPDIISYGAGTYGIESFVSDFTVWCRGNYCLLTLDANCNFSDVTADNTVINRGKDNLAEVVALFCGIQNSKFESPTAAYVKLINGEYKYLLGTQRDIFRLKTRNVSFSIKPVTVFNDLYQNISITTKCENKIYARMYIDYLLSRQNELTKIGMFADGVKMYEDEMGVCENIVFDYRITYPINENMKNDIEKSILQGDINMLKELLK